MRSFCNVCSIILAFNLVVIGTGSEGAVFKNIGPPTTGRPHTLRTTWCYNGQIPMKELIPNFMNCHTYYHCQEIEPNVPFPVLKECAHGQNDTALYYNFRTCQCDYEETVCFDFNIPEHEAEFFTCAEKLRP